MTLRWGIAIGNENLRLRRRSLTAAPQSMCILRVLRNPIPSQGALGPGETGRSASRKPMLSLRVRCPGRFHRPFPHPINLPVGRKTGHPHECQGLGCGFSQFCYHGRLNNNNVSRIAVACLFCRQEIRGAVKRCGGERSDTFRFGKQFPDTWCGVGRVCGNWICFWNWA